MGTFNIVLDIRSMTYIDDRIYQTSAAANRTSLYTVTSFSGKGMMFKAHEDVEGTNIEDAKYFSIIVDGNTEIVDVDSSGYPGYLMYSDVDGPVEFDTSLVVKIGNDTGATKNIVGTCQYASFSEEYQRTLHPAGSQIPDAFGGFRPDTMPIDIMLIWYKSKDGSIGNRMIVTQNKAPLINDKALTGIIRKSQFDIVLKGPKVSWVKDNRNVQMNISITGRNYQADFVNGILIPSSLVLLDRVISKEDFLDRFTLTELEDIELKSETTPKLRAVMNKIGYMEKVDLDAQKMNQLLVYLVSQNVFTGQRKNEILA